MLLDCTWLPLLEIKSTDESDDDYENRIYKIFIHDFVDNDICYAGKPVKIRFSPMINGKLQSFYHVTTYGDDNKSRRIDNERQRRIRWIKEFIEHSTCKPINCSECSGMKVWSSIFKGNISRIKILLEEEKYVVILENRISYVLLITAYYVDHKHTMDKLLKDYRNAKQKAPQPNETPSGTPSTLS